MSLYAELSDLELQIDGYRLEGRVTCVRSGWDRHTTIVRLEGGGRAGVGEDVTYHAGDQRAFQRHGAWLPLAGRHSLDGFSAMLDSLPLFGRDPNDDDSRDYRRWAFEAAALDLALRQNGRTLHGILGVAPRPVRFVVSMSLAEPPAIDPIPAFLNLDPALRFKLDASRGWTDETVGQLADTAAVEIVDLKGLYRDMPVDKLPDAELYRRVTDGLPEAWIEDPALTASTTAILEDHHRRITWDAPIHCVADIERLPFAPTMLNIKPSRFGTLRRLLDAYDHCAEHGIGMYGGGQFELGPGRGQIQYLASLFHPSAPNDVAPIVYHDTSPRAGLPRSPLGPPNAAAGFGGYESANGDRSGEGAKEQA